MFRHNLAAFHFQHSANQHPQSPFGFSYEISKNNMTSEWRRICIGGFKTICCGDNGGLGFCRGDIVTGWSLGTETCRFCAPRDLAASRATRVYIPSVGWRWRGAAACCRYRCAASRPVVRLGGVCRCTSLVIVRRSVLAESDVGVITAGLSAGVPVSRCCRRRSVSRVSVASARLPGLPPSLRRRTAARSDAIGRRRPFPGGDTEPARTAAAAAGPVPTEQSAAAAAAGAPLTRRQRPAAPDAAEIDAATGGGRRTRPDSALRRQSRSRAL